MNSLAELDHPATPYPFPPWNRDVYLRKIGATTLLRLQRDYAELHDADADTSTDDMVAFYADLLAETCVDPKDSKEAWADVHMPNLLELGKLALAHNGLTKTDAKKNSTSNDRSSGSPSPSAEN